MNKLIMMGRATKEPEIRYTNDGKAIARFSLAVNRNYKDAPTDFFNIVSFDKTAQFIENYIHKGSKILVEGKLQNNNYEKDGKKVYSDQIIADRVEFCESKNANNTQTDDEKQTDDGFNQVSEEYSDEMLPFV